VPLFLANSKKGFVMSTISKKYDKKFESVDTTDGTKGFSPQYSGNSKAGKHNTSSFDAATPTERELNHPFSVK
jgi:hypothetical protein